MTPYSYRKTRLAAITLFVASALALTFGQSSRSDRPTLRGTAVMESSAEGLRVIPVCIFTNRQFYDADFYQSTPVPMSLIQGTVYEVQKAGTPIGNFTVNDAERQGTAWYGRGAFRDFSKKSPATPPSAPDDDRPVLKRSAPAANPDAAAKPVTPTPDEQQKANNDEDRPTLKRGTQPQVVNPTPAPAATPAVSKKNAVKQLNAAISDPNSSQSRPFQYEWDSSQQKKWDTDLRETTAAELRKQARARGVTLVAKDKIEFTEFQVRAFDVDYSNNPQVVITARFVPTLKQLDGLSKDSQVTLLRDGLIVTLVGRVNYDQQFERIFGEVSDPRNLDDYPVMELVDAVDVDADNRAELLFANHSESGRRFVVYRLYGLSLNEIFSSAVR